MKKLIFALLFVINVCRAEEWMETANEAGGKILFLSTLCTGSTTGRMVIATIRDGGTVHGCWWFFADMVHVVWTGQNGKTSAFDPKTLTYRKN